MVVAFGGQGCDVVLRMKETGQKREIACDSTYPGFCGLALIRHVKAK